MLFTEIPFVERFAKAAEAGFGTVEFMSPFIYEIDEMVAAAKEARAYIVQYDFLDGHVPRGHRRFLRHAEKR